jgi:hypothetical protein
MGPDTIEYNGWIRYVKSLQANSDRYVRLILTEFFTQLTEEERWYEIFPDTS